jgi:phage gp16-like protein
MSANAGVIRNREIARIKVLSKELGLDDAAYRIVLWEKCKAESAAHLDEAGRRTMIDHLVQRLRLTKPDSPQLQRRRMRARQRASDDKAGLVAKVRALLINASPGPKDDAYADAMALRMFKVARFTWLQPAQLSKLVAALAIDSKRRKTA